MNKTELIELLKDNLRIEVEHPMEDVGYGSTWLEPDTKNIKVSIFFGDELITESQTYD